jgi:hypothetical protein
LRAPSSIVASRFDSRERKRNTTGLKSLFNQLALVGKLTDQVTLWRFGLDHREEGLRGVSRMSEGASVRTVVAQPAVVGARPISVFGWSMAVAAGLLLWAIAFLLIRW